MLRTYVVHAHQSMEVIDLCFSSRIERQGKHDLMWHSRVLASSVLSFNRGSIGYVHQEVIKTVLFSCSKE